MKRLLKLISVILVMNEVLSPFSFALWDDANIFEVEENAVVTENETSESDSLIDDTEWDNLDETNTPEELQEENIQIEWEDIQDSSDENQNNENNNSNWEEDNENSEDNENLIDIQNNKNNDFEQLTWDETVTLVDAKEWENWNDVISSQESQNEDHLNWWEDTQNSMDGIQNIENTNSIWEEDNINTGYLIDMQNNENNNSEQKTWYEIITLTGSNDWENWSGWTLLEEENNDSQSQEWIFNVLPDNLGDVINKIKYFFKSEWDDKYIKYGKDKNNIWIITLKDPKTSFSVTIMDKNLWANVAGIGNESYGYYFQWGNNHWVESVNSTNKTAQKAVYNDNYYSHGYDGNWVFIVWNSDYWENGEHYNSLWWNESKESSRYGACPVGYHIPTMKEWNQLLNIWWKIHTQDTSTSEMVLRYSANYSTKNIQTFKWASTQCTEWDIECIDEDNLSIIIDTLSKELKLPLAGSYDENGNYHDGLWIYWTSISKNGNSAWVFNMGAYIWESENNTLFHKAQGHNIRCFQNIEPYEAPVEMEDQEREEGTEVWDRENVIEVWSEENTIEENIQNDENQWLHDNDIYATWLQEVYTTWQQEDNVYTTWQQEDNVYTTWVQMYTITWKNEDGSTRDTTTVAYGQMPTHVDPIQSADAHYSYEFAWWEPELKAVEWDAEYKAKYIYIPIEYTIIWKNEDGTMIDTTKVAYGQIPTHKSPVQPADEKYSYKFIWWEPKPSEVKWNTEYRAKYEYIVNKFTITRENEDWTIIDTTEVPYGEIPPHEDPIQPADEKYSYEFAWWDSEITEVTWPAEYRATYKYITNKYTVTRKNEDWTILETQEVEYGTTPIYSGATPTKESTKELEYKFVWWEPVIEEIKWDTVYTAKYIESPIIENEESNDWNETQTGSLEEISQDNEQTTEDFQSESQNNENIASWTQWDENGWSYEWGDNTDGNSSTNISEWENTIQEWEISGEGQWFWWWLWETMKSFFLDDEDWYLKGSETIDNVLVSIEAEVWTFPVWTEVVIKWVPQDRLESIQTSLIEDENNNVTKNAQIVAFDISFVYSWEEIQPEKEVSVKFNYKENSDFQWASEKELSVYHIDDETDKWTEIQVTNKDEDEIEILATDFSIYVLTLSDNNIITLTLNPGDWTIITWDNIVVDEQWIWTITSVDGNVTLPNATRDNHVFVWWYTLQTPSLQSFVWNWWDEYHMDADITLYAEWCNDWYIINTDKTTCILEWNLKTIMDQNPNFTWWEKEIPMPLSWSNDEDPLSIVMMDRNLWASTHGTESNAWWYYYQRWNNYGFTQNPPTILRSIANVNLSLYAPSTYYSWTYVIWKVNNTTFPNWATTDNYNIWWYYSGTNEAKQWPCPTNWHVPTIEEWRMVVEYWSWNNGWMNVSNFRAELALPLAWWITRSTATLESGNIAWLYRTVTPDTSKSFAYDFIVKNDFYDVNYSENLVNWRQVRCFKNEDAIVRRYTVTYNDGIDNREIFEDQIFSGLSRWDDFPQFSWQIPWRTGNDWTYHEFLWWFLEWTEIAFDVSGAKVIENVSLYAMWTWCPDGEEPNALGFCVPTAEEQRNRQIVQDLELYLLANDQNKIHYTIMDRNMWATEVFNKYYDSPNPASLGYLYQWWNNYWFPAQWDLAQQWVFIRTSQVPKNIWSAWVPSNYASGTYYSNAGSHASWMGSPSKTDWIWWWTWDTRNANWWNTTLEARQWPCPVWYHVPSTLEWTTIFTDWSWSNIWVSHAKMQNKIEAIYKFSEDLLLPPAWRRGPSWALDYISALSYWSSSPATSDAVRADWLYAKPDDKIEIPNADWRSRARSVRCIKNAVNTSATSISTDDIHLDGWWNAVISIDNWVISTLWTPTRADSTFNGWYTTSDFSWNPLSTWDTVSAWSSLYAKFTCNESWYVWNGTSCEDWVRLIFDSMWWSDVPSQTVKSGTTWVRPADPTKTWYVFNGWFLTWANEEFNFTWTIITEPTTLYAHWNTWQYEVSIVSNNENYGTVNSGLVTADFWTPISTNWNELTIWSITVIATAMTSGEQYTYTFSGWMFENCGIEWAESVTINCEVTANFDRIANGYTVTWNNSDGTTLETDLNVPYGTMPSYDWETPTSGWDAQYSYTFIWWSPATWVVQWDITYTATYTQSINEYTVMIQSSDVNSGTVTTWSITVPYWTSISKVDNVVTIGTETSTANANSQTWQYDFSFVDWSDMCGTTVTTWCTVTANFQSSLRTYTLDLIIGTWIEAIYYKINWASEFINTWITTLLSGIEAWSTIYAYAESKDWYTYTETSESNPRSVLVTWDNVFSPVATANENTDYTVYHYVKIAWQSGYALSKTDYLTWTTDKILILSSLAKESEFMCAHYSSWSLTWTENWPWEIIIETTIKWDGSTKIYLYYTRNNHRVILSGDEHVQYLKINGDVTNEAVWECGGEVPVDAVPKPWYHFVRWDREREEREDDENGNSLTWWL